jgi:broad specificity phosphatase PhoE
MTTIILARHGETEWNAEEIFRGRVDVDLNETGIREAELLAEHLSYMTIAAVYSSPLKRALQTAEMIARHHDVEVEVSPQLIDLDYGEWQGLSHETVRDRYGQLYHEWLNSPQLVKMPAGESLGDVKNRAISLVEDITAKAEDTVVLVSHRVVHKVLICALLALDSAHFWNIRIDTAGISVFAYEDGRFVLTRHNDTSFLNPIHKAPLSDF